MISSFRNTGAMDEQSADGTCQPRTVSGERVSVSGAIGISRCCIVCGCVGTARRTRWRGRIVRCGLGTGGEKALRHGCLKTHQQGYIFAVQFSFYFVATRFLQWVHNHYYNLFYHQVRNTQIKLGR